MRAFAICDQFGLENLKPVDLPEPHPGPGEVCVQIRANSLNYRDLMTVRGDYNPRQPLPLVPLSDGAGEVVAVGPGVSRWQVGDRVMPIFTQGWLAGRPRPEHRATTLGGPLPGTLAERVVLPEQGLVAIPDHLDFAEAATLPCAAVTAWHALFEDPQPLQPGQTLLVLGTGGVSLFALQLAKAAGARVIITSASNDKLQRARDLGADETINYAEQPQWPREVRRLTGNQGADRIIEVGGAGTLQKSIAAARLGGTLAIIGVLGGAVGDFDVRPVLMNALRLQGIMVGSRAMFERMNSAIAQHRLRPVIDQTLPFAQAPEAFHAMAAARHFGKLVITH